jgi:ketosteroid isomerase-like protein
MERGEIDEHARRLYEVFASGERDEYRRLFADDVVWHVPGNNPVSGEYRGADQFFGTMVERMAPLDEWTIRVLDVTTNEKDCAALVAFRLTGSRRGRRIETSGHHMVRFDDEGKVREGWGFTENQAALDEFFSA